MTEVIGEVGKAEGGGVEAEDGVEVVVRRHIDQWIPVGAVVEVKMTGADQILVHNRVRDGGEILFSRLVAHLNYRFSYHPFRYTLYFKSS